MYTVANTGLFSELALQIFEQFKAVSAPQSMKPILITGGTDMRQQAIALANRPHVVISTPGRLARPHQDIRRRPIAGLRRVKMVVLDEEADRLLASGKGSQLPDVETCLAALPPTTERQTLLFTATMTAEVRLLKDMPPAGDKPPMFATENRNRKPRQNPPDPQTILPQGAYDAPRSLPPRPPLHKENISKPVIVFCNHTNTCDVLERTLRRLGHRVTSLHSILPQSERTSNLGRFRATAARVLVATDVASRGLDIPSVSLVVNFDVPRNPDDYVHRVGRTAECGPEW